MRAITGTRFSLVGLGILISALLATSACGEATPSTTSTDLDSLLRYIDVLEESNAKLQRELDEATMIALPTETSTTSSTTTIPRRILSGQMTLLANATTFYTQKVDLLLDEDRRVCTGMGGYEDLTRGASVVVSDGAGEIVATSGLSEGLFDEHSYNDDINWAQGTCVWAFEVEVPADRDFYTVEVSHRGGVAFSVDDLETDNWFVSLSM